MNDSNTQRVKFERKYCPKCYAQYEQLETCPEDGTTLHGQDNDPLIGKVFAERYVIQSVIGLGGMSIVYKAQHKLMDRIVAIKMLHSNIKNDHTSLERFRMEAQAASSLSHQNIIAVYDFGVTDHGDAFFVMDYLDGENLGDLIERKGKIPYERALHIFKQICDGLGAAHKKSIVHRDLKPANVVLLKEDDGTELVKLVDFGIAKLLPASGKQQLSLTRTGEVFGSPIYMSPEQCQGLELDKRSDIYALGCLMYETLTGQPPLIGGTFLETLNMHVSATPKSFSEVVPDAKIPAVLEQVIFKCMAKNPNDRPQSTEEIRDLLSTITLTLSNTGLSRAAVSGPMASVPCPNQPGKINKMLLGGLVASVLGLGSLVAALFLWPGPPDDPGTPAAKMLFAMQLSSASDQTTKGNFRDAEKALNEAANSAKTLTGGSNARLELVLKQKADLYGKWEGHAELLERTNNEIIGLLTQRALDEMKKQYESLDRLASTPTDSTVALTNAKLRAEAQVPSILVTAGKLNVTKLHLEQSKFLERTLEVMRKLLGPDSPSVCRIENSLIDAYLGLHDLPSVRPLLLHICTVSAKDADSKPDGYVRALTRLGQFDLDQSQVKLAEPELKKALELGTKKKVSKDLQVLVMRSWSDVLNQTNHKSEANAILKQADALEKTETDIPPTDKP
ncbi:MAG TPA: serine/threonine-protein kinase [Candidatus Melainabacteria bacterium]|nr:serine/threonine-protein kinase [Candidatus Melainabacteria bacterium]